MLITSAQRKPVKYNWCRFSNTCYKCMVPMHKTDFGHMEGCPKDENLCDIAKIITGRCSAKYIVESK